MTNKELEKKELKEYIKKNMFMYYLRIILGSIFLVLCVIMLGIWLSALWYLEYGV